MVGINKIETDRKQKTNKILRINERKTCFFEKISKTDQLLTTLIKRGRKKVSKSERKSREGIKSHTTRKSIDS